jgi:hypothetical protein
VSWPKGVVGSRDGGEKRDIVWGLSVTKCDVLDSESELVSSSLTISLLLVCSLISQSNHVGLVTN